MKLKGSGLVPYLLLAFGAVGTVVVCGLILNLEANERTRLPIDLEGQREFNREFLADLARPFSWWKR